MLRKATVTGPLLLIALLTLALPAGASAAPPHREHVISARHADAAFSTLDGCLLSEVFVSSMDGMFSGSPGGPLNKQGLTSVLIIVSDTCQPPVGKGYPKVFEGLGQTLDPLVMSARGDEATINAVIPVLDEVAGAWHDVELSLTWVAISERQRDTTHSHVLERHGGVINSAANNWSADAAAFGSVLLDGVNITPSTTFSAHLSEVKQNCLVVQHPRGGADFDCS